MSFWPQFFKESMQSPWWVAPAPPVQKAAPLPNTPSLFLVDRTLQGDELQMVQRMMAALGWDARQVSILPFSAQVLEQLQQTSQHYRILSFSEKLQLGLGHFTHWYGHQIMGTHSLSDLLKTPTLKAATWQHLKEFAGVQK